MLTVKLSVDTTRSLKRLVEGSHNCAFVTRLVSTAHAYAFIVSKLTLLNLIILLVVSVIFNQGRSMTVWFTSSRSLEPVETRYVVESRSRVNFAKCRGNLVMVKKIVAK